MTADTLEKPQYKVTVNVRRFVRLLPTDEFDYETFDKRLVEQTGKRTRGKPRRKLYVMNKVIQSVRFFWWTSPERSTVPLTDLTGLITFKAIPTLLAIGMQSSLHPYEKQYVLMHVPSGCHREELINILQKLCQVEQQTPSQSKDEGQSSDRPQIDYGTLNSSPVVVDHRTQKKKAGKRRSWTINWREKPALSLASSSRNLSSCDDNHSSDSSVREFSSRIVTVRRHQSTQYRLGTTMDVMSTPEAESVRHMPGMNDSSYTYLMHDREKGYLITETGPIYLFCQRTPAVTSAEGT